MFEDYNIVSFWYIENYDKSTLKKLFVELKKEVQGFNENWLIDIPIGCPKKAHEFHWRDANNIHYRNKWENYEQDELMDKKDYYESKGYIPYVTYKGWLNVFMPIKDYMNNTYDAKTDDKAYNAHLLNWKEKENYYKNHKPKGFGSDKKWDKLKGVKSMSSENEMTAAQWEYWHKRESNMMKFDEFINENIFDKAKYKKIPEKQTDWKIYCDLDGVLCDFKKQLDDTWLDKFNKENGTKIKTGWEFEEIYGSKEFWENIGKVGLKFWSEMPWTKDGKKLWNFIKDKNTEILSTPSKDKISRDGKKIWCKRELGDTNLILSYNKASNANPKSILIDDLKKNIEKWNKAGGIGILHKNTEDTLKKLKDILSK